MMIQTHILYSGRVQGVGFRYTVSTLAKQRGICGWAKNLVNGKVEVLLEGTRDAVDELCADIKDRFSDYIQDQLITTQPGLGQFTDFQIRF